MTAGFSMLLYIEAIHGLNKPPANAACKGVIFPVVQGFLPRYIAPG
jgi:hypothetical protein